MTESRLLRHGPCPQCGSTDNLGIYTDHDWCFGCGFYRKTDGSTPDRTSSKTPSGLTKWWIPEEGLPHRKIKQETLRLYRYGETTSRSGVDVEIANYVNRDGSICAQKFRLPPKDGKKEFPWIGAPRDAMPFGYHLDKTGKKLIVTEGEIDCLTVAEVVRNWVVWSVPNGANSAAKDLLKALPTIENFAEVVLFFDNDEVGREATTKAAKALCGSTLVKIARMPKHKDANEAWLAGDHELIMKAIWNAEPYKPDTIVNAWDSLGSIKDRRLIASTPYQWKGFQDNLQGIRDNEIVTIVAGSGTGKSTVCRHLLHYLQRDTEHNVGGLFIEETVETTLGGILSVELGKNLVTNPELVSEVEIEAAAMACKRDTKPLHLFNLAFESLDTEELLSQIRFMAKSLSCKYIVLDHLSFIVGGMDTVDERKSIDLLMTKLRGLVKSVGITLFLVVHLKRPVGNKGYDEGLEVSTNFIRGSQAIEQLSDTVIALERNKRDPLLHNWVQVRILKNRFNGKDGMVACSLEYNPDTGRLTEGTPPNAATDTTFSDASADLEFLDGNHSDPGASTSDSDPLG